MSVCDCVCVYLCVFVCVCSSVCLWGGGVWYGMIIIIPVGGSLYFKVNKSTKSKREKQPDDIKAAVFSKTSKGVCYCFQRSVRKAVRDIKADLRRSRRVSSSGECCSSKHLHGASVFQPWCATTRSISFPAR